MVNNRLSEYAIIRGRIQKPMNWTVVQVRKPIDASFNVTESCFIMVEKQVWTVKEARDIVDAQEKKGGHRDWFIIIQTYPV